MSGIEDSGNSRYRVQDEDAIVRALVFTTWPIEARDDPEGAARRARDDLARLIALGLPFRQDGQGGARRFDLCEVIHFQKRQGLAGRDPAYTGQTVPTWRRLTADSMGDVPAPRGGSRAFAPQTFSVSLRREFNLDGLPPDAPLRLRLPVAIEDASQREVSVEVVGPRPPLATVVRRPGYLEFRVPSPSRALASAASPSGLLAIETVTRFIGFRQSLAIDTPDTADAEAEAELELYTRPREGMVRVTPAVIELAQRLAGRAEGPRATLEAFWAFFFERMTPAPIHHGALDADDPLADLVRDGRFDCFAGSSLLIALCRARGIPARLIQGVMLHERAPCFHYWAEVHIAPRGWVPVDLICWDLALGDPSARPWARLFLGALDYRMKCEVFPRTVVGMTGVRFPTEWYLEVNMSDGGTETSYYSLETSRLIYRDRLRVVRLSG